MNLTLPQFQTLQMNEYDSTTFFSFFDLLYYNLNLKNSKK